MKILFSSKVNYNKMVEPASLNVNCLNVNCLNVNCLNVKIHNSKLPFALFPKVSGGYSIYQAGNVSFKNESTKVDKVLTQVTAPRVSVW